MTSFWPRTFLGRLSLSTSALMLLATLLLGVVASKISRQLLLQEMTRGMRSQLNLIREQIPSGAVRGRDSTVVDAWTDAMGRRVAARITVVAPDGGVLGDSRVEAGRLAGLENHANRPEILAARTEGFGASTRRSSTVDGDFLYAAIPLKETRGVLRFAVDLRAVQEKVTELRKGIAVASLLCFLGALFLSLAATRWMHRPIQELSDAADRIAHGDLGRHVSVSSAKELSRLGETLNALSAKVSDTVTQLRAEKAQLQATLANMVEGVAEVDREGNVLELNPAMEKLFGVDVEKVRGRPFLEAVRHGALQSLLESALASRKTQVSELKLFTPEEHQFEAHANPILDGEEVQGAVLVLHDITRLRRLEKVRQEFVANVSHELRTPLASIRGYAETLTRGAIDDEKNRAGFVQKIQKHADRLTRLLDDLLDLSSIESGRRLPALEAVDLSEAFEEALGMIAPIAERKKLEVDSKPPQGLRVKADRNQLQQVLQNLLDNAVKYTAEGGRLRLEAETKGGEVIVTVSDTGIGIPKKYLPRLFERFYRVDKARSREMGGTGLGLSIVKHIVEAHHGRLWVESEEGEGTTFYFSLRSA